MTTDWDAWTDTKALGFLHAHVRRLLGRQGVEDAFVQHDGHPVHYYAAGPRDAARTVVLLHGLGDSANNWFRTIPLLAWRGDRVVAIDLAGHGYTPAPDERGYVSIRENADLVRHVVAETRAGDDLAIVGHSLGGWVAARYVLDQPRDEPSGLDASRLVLVEAAGLVSEAMWDMIEMLRIEKEQDVRRFFKTVMHRTPFGLGLLSREVASMFRSPAVVNFIGANNREDVIFDEELADIRARTVILWGENDGLIPPIIAHRWHAGIPNSTLKWIPRCGHAPQFERPVLFENMLEEALGHPPLADEVRARVASHMPPWLGRRIAKA